MFLFNKEEEKKHNASLSVGSVLHKVVAGIWFHLSFSVTHVVMLAFMLCVVDFVSLVIGHFLLEGHGEWYSELLSTNTVYITF